MPTLDAHQSFSSVKLLFIGNSGSGKTGGLGSLAKKYSLFIQDYDNGLDILTDPSIVSPEHRKNIHYVTLTDKFKSTFIAANSKTNEAGGNKMVVDGSPVAFSKGISLLSKWVDPDTKEDFGPVTSWGPDRILVIDSLTIQGQAAQRYTLDINGKTGQRMSLPLWGDAIDRQEGLLQMLYSDAIKCHVIVTAHITRLDLTPEDAESYDIHGFPSALGSKLPQRVGRYFNTIVMACVRGTGPSAKRIIRTRSEGVIDLKAALPSKVPTEMPLETGLLDLFTALTTK